MKLSKLTLRKPLPIRDGLSPSAIWLPAEAKESWSLIIDFLCDSFNEVSRQSWSERMAAGEVVDTEGRPFTPDSPYRGDIHLFYYRQLDDEATIPFREEIIYEDERIVVVDKPHFLPTVPAGKYIKETLLVRLQKRLGLEHLVPIHRLDRETAGVVVFCKQPQLRGLYQGLFAKGAVTKCYHAVAPALEATAFPLHYRARLEKGEPFFRMREVAGEPNSHTEISVLTRDSKNWLYELRPISGKKHQLRLHMSALGAPILNDPFYPTLQDEKGEDYSSPLQLLAKSLVFTDPVSGHEMSFRSGRELSVKE